MKTILVILLMTAAGLSSSVYAQLPYEYVSARDYECPAPSGRITDFNTKLKTNDGAFYYEDVCATTDGDPFIIEGIADVVLSKIINKSRIELLSFKGSVTADNQIISNTSETKFFYKASGKLFVTDGSKQGTLELGDFGIYYCCRSYGSLYSAFDLITVLDDVLYFQVNVNSDGYPEDYQLWQTDGTLQGTKIVPNIDNQNITFITNKTGASDESIVFFSYTTFSLWLSDKQQAPELLYSFPDNTSVSYNRSVSTSKGTFFCDYPERQLWKIANDATVSLLANGCNQVLNNPNGAYQNGGVYYWSEGSGLWFSDGNAGSEMQIYSYKPSDELLEDGICDVADKLYFTAAGLVKEVSADNSIKDITASLNISHQPKYLRMTCSDNGMVFSNGNDSVFFDPKQGIAHRIINLKASYLLNSDEVATKGVNAKAILFVNQDYSLFSGDGPDFFYLQPNYGFQVPVLDLLMQDENQTQ